MIEAYPLQWPVNYKRTQQNLKKHAQFQTAFAKARDGIVYELKRMGAKDVIISSNVPLKRDGFPYAVEFGKWKNITDDTGIAVYFNFKNEQKVICCDAYLSLDDNMQAINKTIEALRGIDRWQCSDIINQTFTGFKALPEQTSGEVWYKILEVSANASFEEVVSSYRILARKHHPDFGGDPEKFNTVTNAYKQALQKFNQK